MARLATELQKIQLTPEFKEQLFKFRALPYLISRMDQCYDNIPACREKIAMRPSEYL